MVDLSIAAVALLVLAVVVIAMARGSRRVPIGAGLAVIVLAAGTFGVMLYRSQTTSPSSPVGDVTQQFGAAEIRVEVPMGSGDKLPQGALDLDPPRPGRDAYTGDVSLLCSTPGKAETEQNCSGADRRDWVAAPIDHRARLAAAIGDPFADPAACAESNGVRYQDEYLELTLGRGYCLRTAGQVVAIRIPAFPDERPLPVKIIVQATIVS
jgi:hypothetical protein